MATKSKTVSKKPAARNKKTAAKKPAAKPISKTAAKKPAASRAKTSTKTAAKKPAAKKRATSTATKKTAAKPASVKKTRSTAVKKTASNTPKKTITKPTAAKKTTSTTSKKTTTKPAAAKKTTITQKNTGKKSSTVAKSSVTAPKQSSGAPLLKEVPMSNVLDVRELDFTPYSLKESEEYMNSSQLEHFKRILFAWKQALMEQVDETVSHMQNEPGNLADPNDCATREEEFNLELRTRDRERQLIKKIESTLEQIKQNEYGYCTQCGEEIGVRRLEARPTASLCIDCKTLAEIREKHYSS